MANNFDSPEKITILRLSAIGDVLMLLPAVRLLKRQFPSTQIDWLIDRPIASLISEVSEVNVVAIDKPRSFSNYWQLRKQWRNKNTGQLISFQTSFVSNMLMALLPADHKTGFGAPYSREGHHLFTDTTYELPPQLHQVEIFFALAKKFSGITENIKISTEDLLLPIHDHDKAWAIEQLQAHEHWIAINPMASLIDRAWPAERYVALMDKLHLLYPNQHLVLTGGPSEKETDFAASIQQRSLAPCLNLVGKTTLTQLAAVLKQANLLIAPDTGPLHLANAVTTQVIGLYAAKRPEYIGAYGQIQNCISVYNQAAQSILHKSEKELTWQKNIPGAEAMRLISVEQVLNKIDTLTL